LEEHFIWGLKKNTIKSDEQGNSMCAYAMRFVTAYISGLRRRARRINWAGINQVQCSSVLLSVPDKLQAAS